MRTFLFFLLILIYATTSAQEDIHSANSVTYTGTSTVVLAELDFNGNIIDSGQTQLPTSLIIDEPESYGGFVESNDFSLLISAGESSVGGYFVKSASVYTSGTGRFLWQHWNYEETDPNLYVGSMQNNEFQVNYINGQLYGIPYPHTFKTDTEIAVRFTNSTTIDFEIRGYTNNLQYAFRIVGQVKTNVSTPTELSLISPTLENPLTDTVGNPGYVWTNQGASSYKIYLAGIDPANQLALQTVSADTVCNGTICAIDLTKTETSAWLANGWYQVWLYSNLSDWQGPFWFQVNAPAPTPVTFGNSGISWTLNNSAARASWFQIYIAPTDDIGNPVIFTWRSRSEVCGNFTSTSCSINVTGATAGVQYSLYVQSWGPGGLTDWAGPLLITFS